MIRKKDIFREISSRSFTREIIIIIEFLSENKVEYSVDDEDLWNIGDFVSVVVPEDAMVFESVSEDAE